MPAAGWKTAWRAAVGPGYASPVAHGGKVLLFYQEAGRQREVLAAYDAESGKVLWRDGGFVVGPTGGFPGTRATPTIDDVGQTVTTFGGSGELVRRDLATGTQRWRTNVVQQTGAADRSDGTCSSPLLAGPFVYVQGGFDGPLAVAVHASTGRIAWQSAVRGNSGVAPAVLMQVQGRVALVVLAKESVVGMDPASGATWWTQHLSGAGATPIVVGERLVVTTEGGRGMVVLQPGVAGVRELWSNPRMTSTFVSPVLDGETLYGNSRGTLKSLALADGKLNWAAPKSDFELGFGGSFVRSGDKLLLLGDAAALPQPGLPAGGLRSWCAWTPRPWSLVPNNKRRRLEDQSPTDSWYGNTAQQRLVGDPTARAPLPVSSASWRGRRVRTAWPAAGCCPPRTACRPAGF